MQTVLAPAFGLQPSLAQFPTLPSGAIETWLLCAFAVASIVAIGVKLFIRKTPLEAEFVTKEEFRIFRAAVERDLGGLRDRITGVALRGVIGEERGQLG